MRRRRRLQWQIGKHQRNTKERDDDEEDGDEGLGRMEEANEWMGSDMRGMRSEDLAPGFVIPPTLVAQPSGALCTEAECGSRGRIARSLIRSIHLFRAPSSSSASSMGGFHL